MMDSQLTSSRPMRFNLCRRAIMEYQTQSERSIGELVPFSAPKGVPMIQKNPSTKPGYIRVTFELPSCVWADRIYVSGTFNDWNERAVPLVQGRDGVWRAAVDLPVGRRHEFRYLIDGRWQTDYHADGFTDNIYGSHNSTIDLESTQATVAERQPSKVLDGQPHLTPHLPYPKEGVVRGMNGERAPSDMPRMRPRVAAA